MTITEFYNERFELLFEELSRFAPQFDNETKKYFIIEPFPTIEDYQEEIESDLQDYCEDEELEEDITREEETQLFNELFADFTKKYNRIVEKRAKYE